ncbi:3-hydroxyacyl-CoA dehydrogenase NAD-binding domain-containing protein [Shigella flexneri]
MRIKDRKTQGINHALKYSWISSKPRFAAVISKPANAIKQLALISGTIHYRGFAHRDLIIEAVFEDSSAKTTDGGRSQQNCAPHTVFALDTSSSPIGYLLLMLPG